MQRRQACAPRCSIGAIGIVQACQDTKMTTSSGAWPPRTEEQLSLAAANEILIESHTLDLKRELKGGESGNKEIAKDIAAVHLARRVPADESP